MVSRVATRIRGVLSCGGFSSCVSCCSLLSALLLFVLDGVSHNLSAPIFPTQARQKQLSQTHVGLISALGSLSDILASLLLIFIARPTNQALENVSSSTYRQFAKYYKHTCSSSRPFKDWIFVFKANFVYQISF